MDSSRSGRARSRQKEMGPCIEFTELNRPTRFLSDMRFRIDLPEVVFTKTEMEICNSRSFAI